MPTSRVLKHYSRRCGEQYCCASLHHPRTCEAEVVLAGAAHDDVVEDPHTNVLQGLSDLVCGVDVLLGGVALSTWMVVHEHDAASVMDAGLADDVGRVHDAGADAAPTNFGVFDDFVADVQQDDIEELLSGIAQLRREPVADVVDGILGTGDPFHCGRGALLQALANFDGRLEFHRLGEANAAHVAEVLDAGLIQLAPAAKPVEHVATQFLGALAVAARPEQNGQQACVAHRVGSTLRQLLAGTFVNRPVFDGNIRALGVDARPDFLADSGTGFLCDEVQCLNNGVPLLLFYPPTICVTEPDPRLGPHWIRCPLNEIRNRFLAFRYIHPLPLSCFREFCSLQHKVAPSPKRATPRIDSPNMYLKWFREL